MKKILLAVLLLLCGIGTAQAQMGSKKSFRVNDTLFVDVIRPDSNATLIIENYLITGGNSDSVGHKSITQIYVIMRDTANKAIRDSLALHYKATAIDLLLIPKTDSSEVRAILRDSLALHYSNAVIIDLVSDSINALDSTKVVDGKLGIGDVNNLWTLINARFLTSAAAESLATKLARAAARDSVNAGLAAADSSNITDGKLGIGDINNLWTLINARALFSAMVDSFATKATTAGLGTKKDTSQVEDDAHVANTITLDGTVRVTNLNDSLGTKATPQTVSDSLAAHRAPGIITLVPDWQGAQFSVLSADTAGSVIVTRSGDSSYYRCYTTDTTIDSLLISVTIPIPADFLRFNTDSAIVVTFWASGNSTDSSYLELDVWKYPGTAELDTVKLARNASWGQIVVKGAAMTTNTWTDGDAVRLDFTVGIKNNHEVKLERVIMKYVRK